MLKWFCDMCGAEIQRNYVADRLIRQLGDFRIEVHVSSKGISNNGDICFHCLQMVMFQGEIVQDE